MLGKPVERSRLSGYQNFLEILILSGILLFGIFNPGASAQGKVLFDTNQGTYPSISGEHQGNFTPKCDIEIEKLYTYYCFGTGGHSEYVTFFYQNGTEIENASWNDYANDYHNITFDEPIRLLGNETYKYLIRTGSYPQIVHKDKLENEDGIITCVQFKDINGRIYYDWIPAIKFIGHIPTIPDTTPPGSVKNLNATVIGLDFINWTWTNPADEDYAKAMIYLNGEFKENVSKPVSFYNATNLTPDTLYELGIRTVDLVGNINQTWVNATARTLKEQELDKYPVIIDTGNYTGVEKYAVKFVSRAYSDYKNDSLPVESKWEIFDGEELLDTLYGDATHYEFDKPGNYTARLTVRDDLNRKSSRDFNVEIKRDTDEDGLTDETDIEPMTANDRYVIGIFPKGYTLNTDVINSIKEFLPYNMKIPQENIRFLKDGGATVQDISDAFNETGALTDEHDISYVLLATAHNGKQGTNAIIVDDLDGIGNYDCMLWEDINNIYGDERYDFSKQMDKLKGKQVIYLDLCYAGEGIPFLENGNRLVFASVPADQSEGSHVSQLSHLYAPADEIHGNSGKPNLNEHGSFNYSKIFNAGPVYSDLGGLIDKLYRDDVKGYVNESFVQQETDKFLEESPSATREYARDVVLHDIVVGSYGRDVAGYKNPLLVTEIKDEWLKKHAYGGL